jgi:hypothetical protein
MAKKSLTISIRGWLDMSSGLLTEVDAKTGVETSYSLFEELRQLDGKQISVTIKEDTEIDPID